MSAKPIAVYIGLADAAEKQLENAFAAMADRHSSDPEVMEACRKFVLWCEAHRQGLRPFAEKYGSAPSVDPERVRSALFHGARVGGMGLLRDLHDLHVLASQVVNCWTPLMQGAHALRDDDFKEACGTYRIETQEQIKWIETHLEISSPQILTVPGELHDELSASVPKKPSPAGLPDALWAPIAGAVMLLIIGFVGVALKQPLLFPALGPSAFLVALTPAMPATRGWNTFVGHAIGLAAGFAAVYACQAIGEPSVLTQHVLTAPRVLASALAIALTLLLQAPLKAEHPPAAATTLLVTLGAFKTTRDAMISLGGAALMAILGEAFRRLRLQGSRAPRVGKAEDVEPVAPSSE
jgi:hypothetical protein